MIWRNIEVPPLNKAAVWSPAEGGMWSRHDPYRRWKVTELDFRGLFCNSVEFPREGFSESEIPAERKESLY